MDSFSHPSIAITTHPTVNPPQVQRCTGTRLSGSIEFIPLPISGNHNNHNNHQYNPGINGMKLWLCMVAIDQ